MAILAEQGEVFAGPLDHGARGDFRADQWPPMKKLSSTILPFFTV
jgi:hypothetical protein